MPLFVCGPSPNLTTPFPRMVCEYGLRSISRLDQIVFIESEAQSRPAPLNQRFPNATVNGPPQADAWALTPGLVCRPACRLAWPCCRRTPAAGGPSDSAAGLRFEGRRVEGRRGGPGVGERGVVWRSWFRRSWPAADRGDGRLSRVPAERAGVAAGPPAPRLCSGGPDDRSETDRREGCPGLLAGLAGGISSPPAATRPGPPAGGLAQQVASSPRSEPGGAFGPLSATHDNRSTKPRGDEEELLARWADERRGRGNLSRPVGPGWGNGWPFGPTR